MSGKAARAIAVLKEFRDDPAKRKVASAITGILVCGYAFAVGMVIIVQYYQNKNCDNGTKNDLYYGLGIAQVVIAIFAFIFIILLSYFI